MKNILLCLFILVSLTSCKIDINIFGRGKVDTASGTINCTGDGSSQSGDCTQTYNVDENNVACNPSDPDCTVVTDTITETYTATPVMDDTFDGFADLCVGAGPCIKTITEADANADQAVVIEAHFDEEPIPLAATYNYNYLNQRTSKLVAGVTTYFIYDEQGNLLSEIDQNGNSIKDYVYMDGEYVAHVEKTGDTSPDEWGDPHETLEQVFYPINDHLGQPMMIMRADMQLSHEQYTDPYGKVYAQYVNASLGGTTGPTKQNRRLPGQYYDSETGYSQNWNRDYDPSLGIYLQSDPIGINGGINTYLYAAANPVMNVDFMGLDLTEVQKTAVVTAAQDWTSSSVPYVSGGATKKGADCSGAISAIYAQAGIDIGRQYSQTFKQSELFVKVTDSKQVGDVGVYPGHVVLYGGSSTGTSGHDVWSAFGVNSSHKYFGLANSRWFGSPEWYRYCDCNK